MKRLLLILMLLGAVTINASAQQPAVDSVTAKPSFFRSLLNYVAGDIDAPEEKATTGISVIGGPHFDSMTKFGIGIAGNYGYRLRGGHAPLQPSNLSVKADVSTAKFWSVEAQNNMVIAADKYRMNTQLRMEYMPAYYWGIRFENAKVDEHKTRMKQMRVLFNTDFLFRIADGLYAGPYLHWEFNRADSIDFPELLEGQALHQRNYGVGLTVDYDTRDNITGPTRGLYVHLSQVFFPRFLWNGNHGFTRTDFRFSIYKKAWRGAIIAAEARALFNYGSPSWATLALWGDSNNMRGYYRGRYRDKHMLNATVELRQKLWRWLGMVAWVGGGSVFHSGKSMHFLPNAGLGLRWAFRKHVNIRLDYGFGRAGERAFIFGINEAF